jgi:hypothetical protein
VRRAVTVTISVQSTTCEPPATCAAACSARWASAFCDHLARPLTSAVACARL